MNCGLVCEYEWGKYWSLWMSDQIETGGGKGVEERQRVLWKLPHEGDAKQWWNREMISIM